MDTKLTLKLDKMVIERAKEYASSNNRSLSRIIESYLQSLTIKDDSNNDKTEIHISPFVKSMASGVQIPADLDYKKDYSNYLTDKYKWGLNSNFSDFEDSLQYFSALESDCSILITRNGRDFKDSQIPVLTADEYLMSIKNNMPGIWKLDIWKMIYSTQQLK